MGMDREQLGIKPKTQRGTLKAFYRNSVHEGGYLLPLGDIGGEFMSLLEKLAERYSVSVPELRSNTIVNIKAVRLMAQASKEVMATEDWCMSMRYLMECKWDGEPPISGRGETAPPSHTGV